MLVEFVKRISLDVYYSAHLAKEMLLIGVLLTRPIQAMRMLADLESINTTDPF